MRAGTANGFYLPMVVKMYPLHEPTLFRRSAGRVKSGR